MGERKEDIIKDLERALDYLDITKKFIEQGGDKIEVIYSRVDKAITMIKHALILIKENQA